MNKSSLIKLSIVCATVLVAVGATVPQKVLARETGTVPIIKTSSANTLSKVKDNTTTPIIVNPSNDDVTAPPSCTPDDTSFTITITVNAPVTEDTVLTLETNHQEAINLPSSVVVSAGNSEVTTTVGVVPGTHEHHKNVRIHATANGTTVEALVRVHYHGEID